MKPRLQSVPPQAAPPAASRVDWIDYAKGVCIILMVMFQATHGVEDRTGETGWLHDFVTFATPLRMPAFFLVSGLLLSRVIDRDWRTYLDNKVVHFAYFYILWLTIQFAFKAPFMSAEQGWPAVVGAYFAAYVSPFASLWFIYVLPIFFVVTRLLRGVNPLWVLALAALIEILPSPDVRVLSKFTQYYVYFFAGYLFAPQVFAYARRVQAAPGAALIALAIWAAVNGAVILNGFAAYPVVSLALGLFGAAAAVAIAALVARRQVFSSLAYCGQQSLVIYLAYFLPMAATRLVLLRTGWLTDVGLLSLITTVAGVVGALVMYWLVRDTRLRFLFERPAAFSFRRQRPAGGPAVVVRPTTDGV